MTILIELEDYVTAIAPKHEIDIQHTIKPNWLGKLNSYTEYEVVIEDTVPDVNFYNAQRYYTKYFREFWTSRGLKLKNFHLGVHLQYDKVKKEYTKDKLRIYASMEFKDK